MIPNPYYYNARNIKIKEILESASRSKTVQGTPEQRLGDFFASGMDEKAIAKAGLAPLKGGLGLIAAVKDADSLSDALAWMRIHEVAGLFGFGVGQDDKDAAAMIAGISQPHLGLPEREFYFRQDARSKEIRAAYEAHVARMFRLAGAGGIRAAAEARAVLELETVLAGCSRKLVDLRDPEANYHRLDRGELKVLAPGFPWDRYFAAIGLAPSEKSLLVGQPEVLQALSGLVGQVPAPRWQALLRWDLLRGLSEFLPKAFEDESFAFYGKALSGRQELLPRWRRVMAATDGALGFDLGRLYTARAFPPESKAKVEEMVRFHKAAMKQIILARTILSIAGKSITPSPAAHRTRR